ncbi:MAG: hypothetical protein ACLSVD_05495 [Eggerthellaceae bacterium]
MAVPATLVLCARFEFDQTALVTLAVAAAVAVFFAGSNRRAPRCARSCPPSCWARWRRRGASCSRPFPTSSR